MLIAFALGTLIGWSLYRTKTCFANSFIQFIYSGDKKGLQRLVFILLLSFLVISSIQVLQIIFNWTIPQGKWQVGLPTILGAILFGIGMTFSGSCTITTLIRIGEGTKTYLIVAVGVFIGYFIGGTHYESLWEDSYIFTNQPLWVLFPWWFYVLTHLGLLIILYLLLRRDRFWN